jgi:hypothetical protein
MGRKNKQVGQALSFWMYESGRIGKEKHLLTKG